jgi:Zn-finger nucleic acid-binding protein
MKHAEDGPPIHSCPSCRSAWAPRAGLQSIIEAVERRFTAETLAALRAEGAQRKQSALAAGAPAHVAYKNCPECGAQMHRRVFAPSSGIVADACALHGYLLEAGQLDAIRDFVARGGDVLALEAVNQELTDHLGTLKRKVTDQEQARASRAGGVDIFFIG